MKTTTTLIRYLVAGLAVLILGGLAGWSFYINYQTRAAATLGTQRGYDVATPNFGSPEGSTQTDIEETLGGSASTQESAASGPLWEVDETPVAGFGFQEGASSTPTATLFFAERANGNVFQADPSSRSVVRLTDTLLAKTYEAYFAPGGGVIERSVDDNGDITTFQGEISTTTPDEETSTSTPDTLAGNYLAAQIAQLSLDPESGALVYVLPSPSGGINVTTQPWTTTAKNGAKTVFSSIVGSFRVFALSDGRIILLENPADNLSGYAYTVSSSGALTPLASGLGLTIAPDPGTSALIFGTSADGVLSLYAQTSPKSAPVALSIHTIADKCAWLPGQSMTAYCAVPTSIPSQTFLDDWYRGAVHTSDSVWMVDASTGSSTVVYSPQANSPALDVQDPMIDPSGNYFTFINAADKSLWTLNIAQ